MTSTFVNILIFVRNKYHPLGMQRVKFFCNEISSVAGISILFSLIILSVWFDVFYKLNGHAF